MITQISILMVLLQILIGCGERLDVCKHDQLSSVMSASRQFLTQPELSQDGRFGAGMEDDKTTLKIPCEYLYKETDDPDFLYKIGQTLKCGDKIGTDKWNLYCSEDGYVKCGEKLPASGNTFINVKDDLKDPDYVKSLNKTELHNKIISDLVAKTLYRYEGFDEDGRIKTRLSELQKEELERLLKCKTLTSIGESSQRLGFYEAHVVCEEDDIAPSIFKSQSKRNDIVNVLRILNKRKINAIGEELTEIESNIKKLEKELEDLDNPNLNIEDADWD